MSHARRVKAFDAVLNRHAKFLEAVLWKLTGDRERFAEAWQNTLLALWRHVDKLNDRNARSYLYRIALSAVSNAWRQQRGFAGEPPDFLADTEKGPHESAADSELTRIVRQAIPELPPQQARAVVMRYLESKEYQQLAQEMGCSEAAARSHVSKGLAALKTRLGGLFPEERCHE